MTKYIVSYTNNFAITVDGTKASREFTSKAQAQKFARDCRDKGGDEGVQITTDKGAVVAF